MKIIEQEYKILTSQESIMEMSKIVEKFGRKCWKSEDRITDDSHDGFICNIRGKHHDSVIEHCNISYELITSRAVTHQLVRHRIASYSQESQRYVNYSKDKFGGQIKFIKPVEFDIWSKEKQDAWVAAMEGSEQNYMKLIEVGLKPEEARDALNNACATDIGITMNARQINHVLAERCSSGAQKQTRFLFMKIREELIERAPWFFKEIE